MLAFIQKKCPNATLIKSIYFDKPPNANWLVNWHQDLTINVKEKKEQIDFKNWRVSKERVVVQPSLHILEQILTIRLHLDKCTIQNGALKVIPKSHQDGVISIKQDLEKYKPFSEFCEVSRGGILVMRPLLLHASKRTENNLSRRVIHMEFSNLNLPKGLNWKESIKLN